MNDNIEILRMPKLGMSMTEGKVTEWYYQLGDNVDEGDEIVEVTTEKITHGVCCDKAGILRRILVQLDESATVEAPLAIIATLETSDTEIEQALEQLNKNG